MTLNALIVDDEQLAREELEFLLHSQPDVNVVGQSSNGIEAFEMIRSLRPDVVFLDVQMPGLDGFALLRRLIDADGAESLPQIVFATAFDQYAVRAFDVNAIDYLLKPFDGARLAQALDRVRTRRSDRAEKTAPLRATDAHLSALLRLIEKNGTGRPQSPGKVVLQSGTRLLLIDQKDICFAAVGEGVITVTTPTAEGQSKCRTLEELLEQLDPGMFWRAHRSFIVNLNHIREVVPWFKSSYQLRMDDRKNSEVPVSRTQTRRLRELFNL